MNAHHTAIDERVENEAGVPARYGEEEVPLRFIQSAARQPAHDSLFPVTLPLCLAPAGKQSDIAGSAR